MGSRATVKEEILTLEGFTFVVHYKNVKRLSIRIKPDLTLAVSVPFIMRHQQVVDFLKNNLDWVRQKLPLVKEREDNGAENDMSFPGDDTYFYLWGRRLETQFITRTKKDTVRIEAGRAIFYVRTLTEAERLTSDYKIALIKSFCDAQLYKFSLEFIVAYMTKMNVQATKISTRLMKTRWGSCNVRTGAISLNLLLACYPPEYLEYIVVHELAHLIEPNHSPRFHAVVESYLPDWRERKQHLREAVKQYR